MAHYKQEERIVESKTLKCGHLMVNETIIQRFIVRELFRLFMHRVPIFVLGTQNEGLKQCFHSKIKAVYLNAFQISAPLILFSIVCISILRALKVFESVN